MEADPRTCMFCHEDLPRVEGQPVNLAFLEHIWRRPDCEEEFQVWTVHMQKDFKGD